mmetsp:Transcript_25464/g.52786  ORF Transcript_25464/g.52786 Transcript_25464/m.52786 type:complete len:424 (+) Transcript_25464:59-1330(+)
MLCADRSRPHRFRTTAAQGRSSARITLGYPDPLEQRSQDWEHVRLAVLGRRGGRPDPEPRVQRLHGTANGSRLGAARHHSVPSDSRRGPSAVEGRRVRGRPSPRPAGAPARVSREVGGPAARLLEPGPAQGGLLVRGGQGHARSAGGRGVLGLLRGMGARSPRPPAREALLLGPGGPRAPAAARRAPHPGAPGPCIAAPGRRASDASGRAGRGGRALGGGLGQAGPGPPRPGAAGRPAGLQRGRAKGGPAAAGGVRRSDPRRRRPHRRPLPAALALRRGAAAAGGGGEAGRQGSCGASGQGGAAVGRGAGGQGAGRGQGVGPIRTRGAEPTASSGRLPGRSLPRGSAGQCLHADHSLPLGPAEGLAHPGGARKDTLHARAWAASRADLEWTPILLSTSCGPPPFVAVAGCLLVPGASANVGRS